MQNSDSAVMSFTTKHSVCTWYVSCETRVTVRHGCLASQCQKVWQQHTRSEATSKDCKIVIHMIRSGLKSVTSIMMLAELEFECSLMNTHTYTQTQGNVFYKTLTLVNFSSLVINRF